MLTLSGALVALAARNFGPFGAFTLFLAARLLLTLGMIVVASSSRSLLDGSELVFILLLTYTFTSKDLLDLVALNLL